MGRERGESITAGTTGPVLPALVGAAEDDGARVMAGISTPTALAIAVARLDCEGTRLDTRFRLQLSEHEKSRLRRCFPAFDTMHAAASCACRNH